MNVDRGELQLRELLVVLTCMSILGKVSMIVQFIDDLSNELGLDANLHVLRRCI
jgi:hypothetical protein